MHWGWGLNDVGEDPDSPQLKLGGSEIDVKTLADSVGGEFQDGASAKGFSGMSLRSWKLKQSLFHSMD